MKSIFCLLASTLYLTAAPLVWNAKNNFEGWTPQESLASQRTESTLRLTDIPRDAKLLGPVISINPLNYNCFAFDYRATKTGEAGGQLFFAHQPGQFSQQKMWQLPPLNRDGNWHTTTVTLKSIAQPQRWLGEGPIVQLRLDPTDSPGGTIDIAEIRLYHDPKLVADFRPLPKVKPVLDEAPWPEVKPEFKDFSPQVYPSGPYFKGKLIVSPRDIPYGGNHDSFYLRRSFNLKAAPAEAWLQYIADDSASAFVNGTEVARASNWRQTEVVEVANELRPGENTIAFNYRNTLSAGGVMAELFIRFQDGSCQYVNSDRHFKSSIKAQDGWNQNGFDDAAWESVQEKLGPPAPPWTHRVVYRNFASPQAFLGAHIPTPTLAAGAVVPVTFRFKGTAPQTPLKAVLVMRKDDSVFWEEHREFTDAEIIRDSQENWRLTFRYRLPICLRSNKMTLRIESHAIFCHSGGMPQVTFDYRQLKAIPGFEKPPHVRMAQTASGPTIMLNGKPFYPLWGGVAYKKRKHEIPRYNDAKLSVINVSAETSLCWPRLGTFNPASLDLMAEKYVRQYPDAWFMWGLSLYPPADWAETYPQELCLDDHGIPNRDMGVPNYSLASQQVRKEYRRMLTAIITYLESSPYANRIIGYSVNGGHTIEWLGWDPKPKRILDFSRPAREGFRNYAMKHYPNLKDFSIPTLADRRRLDDGWLIWNPKKHLPAIAYHEFYSHATADMLIDLCAHAKKILKERKLVGTYYGYTVTLNSSGCSQMRAHFALKKVLESGAVDFLKSPQAYSVRKVGDTNADMKPFASIANHTIMPVIEDDARTHNGPFLTYSGNQQTLTEHQTVGVLRRNMGITACRNQPFNFICFMAGSEVDFPTASRDMDSLRTACEHALERQVVRDAETAIVVSEKNITSMPMITQSAPSGELSQYYNRDGSVKQVRNIGTALTTESFCHNLTRYARMGAPTDYLLAEDLKDHRKTYKLYIFVNCFRYDRDFLQAVRKLQQNKVTLLWVYAPGYTTDGANSLANMKRLTGMTFALNDQTLMPAVRFADGRWMGSRHVRIAPTFHLPPAPGITSLATYENGKTGCAMAQTGQAISIFIGTYQFDMPFLMRLVRHAKVHCYSDSSDPMEANSMFVTLHARFPGQKTIRLKQTATVIDVFNKKLVARNATDFSFEAPLHSSWLFYYGPEAEKLLDKLNGNHR